MDDLLRCAEHEFEDAIRFVPQAQQGALRLIRYMGIPPRDVVRVCGRDVGSDGLRVAGSRREWPADGERAAKLAEDLLERARHALPSERLFEAHKHPRVAAAHLARAFGKGMARYREHGDPADPAKEVRLPDFLVLGAPRCATTWLYRCLAKHPDVYVPDRKELEFFGTHFFSCGLRWYGEHFDSWAGEAVGGDVSVGYFHRPVVPEQIREVYGEKAPRMIAILREPVERTVSHYYHRLYAGDMLPPIEKAIETWSFRSRCIEIGHYVRAYRRYRKWFSQEDMLILLYEWIRENPQAVMNRVLDFLGVDHAPSSGALSRRANAGRRFRSDAIHRLAGYLGAYAAAVPRYGRRLRVGIRDLDRTINMKARTGPYRIQAGAYERLKEEFVPSNEALARETGLDLGVWERASGVIPR